MKHATKLAALLVLGVLIGSPLAQAKILPEFKEVRVDIVPDSLKIRQVIRMRGNLGFILKLDVKFKPLTACHQRVFLKPSKMEGGPFHSITIEPPMADCGAPPSEPELLAEAELMLPRLVKTFSIVGKDSANVFVYRFDFDDGDDPSIERMERDLIEIVPESVTLIDYMEWFEPENKIAGTLLLLNVNMKATQSCQDHFDATLRPTSTLSKRSFQGHALRPFGAYCAEVTELEEGLTATVFVPEDQDVFDIHSKNPNFGYSFEFDGSTVKLVGAFGWVGTLPNE